ncbi:MAG: TIGR03032 family protein [Planctomycetes bacterium]|nr:TIGR03032 family protein [Planctomycetota bacterium]
MGPPVPSEASPPKPEQKLTPVHYEHTGNFVGLLEQLRLSLLVSTYQAGKVLAVGTHAGAIAISFHNFEQAMGVAVKPGRVAVGTRRQIWTLRSAPDLAARIEPAGQYDACFLTRSAHYTGPIHGHELTWSGDELWIVNTLFSCLCTLQEEYSFVPRWRPPFISALAAEDRCHLNGMALVAGRPRYVTALAECDTPAGWRPTKATSGCLIDVDSGQVIARGLAMPHSPRVHDHRLWVLDSGHGRLSVVDAAGGRVEPVAHLKGYTRGLALHGGFAFIGLSRIRETSVFGGIPIAEQRDQLECGVAVVDLQSGRQVAALVFRSGVEEVFAVQTLPGVRCPTLAGPLHEADGYPSIWLVPQPGERGVSTP